MQTLSVRSTQRLQGTQAGVIPVPLRSQAHARAESIDSRQSVRSRDDDSHEPWNPWKPLKRPWPRFGSDLTNVHGWLLDYDLHVVYHSFFDALVCTDAV